MYIIIVLFSVFIYVSTLGAQLGVTSQSQVVYSKQPKLGLTQEFVMLLVRMRLVVCLFVCLFVITCLFVLQAI